MYCWCYILGISRSIIKDNIANFNVKSSKSLYDLNETPLLDEPWDSLPLKVILWLANNLTLSIVVFSRNQFCAICWEEFAFIIVSIWWDEFSKACQSTMAHWWVEDTLWPRKAHCCLPTLFQLLNSSIMKVFYGSLLKRKQEKQKIRSLAIEYSSQECCLNYLYWNRRSCTSSTWLGYTFNWGWYAPRLIYTLKYSCVH